jgi:hypothetical protein
MRTVDQGMEEEVQKGPEPSSPQHKEGSLKLHLKLALSHVER